MREGATSALKDGARADGPTESETPMKNHLRRRHLRFITEPTGAEPTGGGAATTTAPAAGGAEYTPPATQADLDRIITDRLSRAKSAAPADYDDLKQKAKRLDEIEAANASDLDKAVKKAREEGSSEATARANVRLVSSEVRAVAAELGFRDPADALAQYGDLTKVTVTDTDVDSAAVKARLSELAKAKPYLLKGDDIPSAADAGIGAAGAATTAQPGTARLEQAYSTTSRK